MKFDLGSAFIEEARTLMTGINEPVYRADQVYKWIHQRQAASFDEMTDLPKDLRVRLSEAAFFSVASVSNKKNDPDGTIKYLFELENHNIIDKIEYPKTYIETVLMNYRHGAALCVSTQAGCSMGCVFCASGKEGLLRDLSAGEMLAQVYAAARDSGKSISNVTLMGCGEPLHNYNSTLRFIRLLNAKAGLCMSQRRITLSTCGLTDGILKLKDEGLQITLAVSLHAPNDRVRAELMPVTRAYPLDGLLAACRRYADTTKRRVTYEYAMIMGKNDRPDHASELAAKLKNTLCHVNLIPVNSDPGSKKRGYRPSSENNIAAFKDILTKHGVQATVRRTLGSGINAACGQLVASNNH